MAIVSGTEMRELSEGITREIREAWQNLEVARATLTRAEELTDHFRKMLGGQSPNDATSQDMRLRPHSSDLWK